MKWHWWYFAIGLLLGALLSPDPNLKPTYGTTGLPRNCKAVIAENIVGWRMGLYQAAETMTSIERNCGMTGPSWGYHWHEIFWRSDR